MGHLISEYTACKEEHSLKRGPNWKGILNQIIIWEFRLTKPKVVGDVVPNVSLLDHRPTDQA